MVMLLNCMQQLLTAACPLLPVYCYILLTALKDKDGLMVM
jgi:hypothetical protein